MKRTFILALIVSVVFVCPLMAVHKGEVVLNFMGGAAFPLYGSWEKSDNSYDESYFAAVSQDYSFRENLAAGLELSYNFNHKDEETKRREIKILNITPYFKLSKQYGFLIPFAIFGAGISFVNMDDDVRVPDLDDTTKRYFSVIYGGGIMWDASNSLRVGIDVRTQHIFISSLQINNIVPTFKLSYKFNCFCRQCKLE